MSQFQIGQVIYVLSNKTQTVLPGIVLEEIYHKRLDGDSVSYKMAIGPINNRKNVDLAKVDGEIYGSLEEIKNVLLEKVNAFVQEETSGRVKVARVEFMEHAKNTAIYEEKNN